MTVNIATQDADIKGIFRVFLEANFNGASHPLSGVSTAFPACYVRMTHENLPQDTTGVDAKLDKPLIRVLSAPGGKEKLRGKRALVGVTQSIGYTKRHSYIYHLYVMTTQVTGGALICDQVASLAKALLESSEANTLSSQGLKGLRVSEPSNLRIGQFWGAQMVLGFDVNLEYS